MAMASGNSFESKLLTESMDSIDNKLIINLIENNQINKYRVWWNESVW